jgi:hypothetical protein
MDKISYGSRPVINGQKTGLAEASGVRAEHEQGHRATFA